MTNIVMECHNIWKKINHHVIVNDLSFNLYEGDILGFIGQMEQEKLLPSN